ncbi:hypothetical protein A3C95_02085 [Candidatus Kaiserbacteria bacterium RIFCSPHIGHO2_02_FULL_56_30]|uniref:Plasmid stabilization protein n=1 Tax=Candidatus Kaiserbacteria bacterium RIFCSPHIGHO2_02_FULL_56_30 TaxID=1798499 RepID=A0A1F6E2I8_9BACT|nr:MAG: hypothetical protein A3C95_02085 [Candidatus Kaiserbacteria bacterium RIFCSPHIGHO2_02_FULL_56_30]
MDVEYSRRFLKSASNLPKSTIRQAEEKESLFRKEPFHSSLRTHKLHGKDKDSWAFSINVRYRIKFIFLSKTRVLFLDIGLHDIYS